MDKLIIKDSEYSCHVGVSEDEQKQLQIILIDLTLFFDAKPAARSDDIQKTVDYNELSLFIKQLLEKREYHLIETLAEDIARNILDKFCEHVIIKVKKIQALSHAKYCAVEIERKNE